MTEQKRPTSRQSGLPHDPLAWLDLPTPAVAAAPVAAEPTIPGSATPGPTALEPADPGANPQPKENTTQAVADDENGGFGFFANELTPAPPPPNDTDGGFGFFANDTPSSAAGDLIHLDVLTINTVEAWHQRLSTLLDSGDSFALDAAELEQIDGCGLQLLCSFFASAESRRVAVRWQSASARLSASARHFGVDGTLHLPAQH